MFDEWHEERGTGKGLATLGPWSLFRVKIQNLSMCDLETKGLGLSPELPSNSLFNLAQ